MKPYDVKYIPERVLTVSRGVEATARERERAQEETEETETE